MRKIKFFALVASLVLGVLPILTGCGASKHDYVKDCKLDTTYSLASNTFLDNGIGEVTLKQTVDGDTAHFYQKEVDTAAHPTGRVVKVRFLGVDTPESTGQIEPWGKKASAFTSSKLLSAKTIVLTVDVANIGTAAQFDSTGTRYVGFVWVSDVENCPLADLQLLNLWVVQEGWSNAKSITESLLVDYFIDADMQAQKLKLGQWAGDDPDYDKGAANETTIKIIMDSFVDDGDDCPWIDCKVAVEGIVYKVVGTDCYINRWFTDPVSNEVAQYGLYIFSGYKNYAPLKSLGSLIRVVGNFQNHYGSPQLTNVSYNALYPTDDDMSILEKTATEGIKIPTVHAADVVDKPVKLNDIVRLENLTPTGGYNEKDATTQEYSGAFTLNCTDSVNAAITIRVPSDVWALDVDGNRVTDYAYYTTLAKTLNITGAFTVFESSTSGHVTYQIKLCYKTDLTINS